MDAGLAAVCGALAGAAGTVGAGIATGWTQRQVARITARAEHTRQRRESRLSVYKEFISAYEEFQEITIPVVFMSGPRQGFFTAELENSVGQSMQRLKGAWLDVALAGPEETSRKADALFSAARVATARIHEIAETYHTFDVDPEQLGSLWESLAEMVNVGSIRDFTVSAQTVLDDDGSSLA
ncbi:hypothetical protein [Streptomyces sp. NPDC001658]